MMLIIWRVITSRL